MLITRRRGELQNRKLGLHSPGHDKSDGSSKMGQSLVSERHSRREELRQFFGVKAESQMICRNQQLLREARECIAKRIGGAEDDLLGGIPLESHDSERRPRLSGFP